MGIFPMLSQYVGQASLMKLGIQWLTHSTRQVKVSIRQGGFCPHHADPARPRLILGLQQNVLGLLPQCGDGPEITWRISSDDPLDAA